MRLLKAVQTTTFRLAVTYVAAFAICVVALGAVSYLITAGVLQRRLDNRIQHEMNDLHAVYQSRGVSGLIDAVAAHERGHPNGAIDFAVLENGARAAGHLTKWPDSEGWADLKYRESNGDEGQRRFLTKNLGDRLTLVVAADPEQLEEIEAAIFNSVVAAFAAVLALGIVGGIGLSLAMLRQVESIRRTAEAIIAGNLDERIPVRGSNDDFDRLSRTLNRMLDRITDLMESLRQISAEIAHDLKTPLARLRQRLEIAQSLQDRDRAKALHQSLEQVDEILATFSALLRIAQIEAGTRRAGFARLDLSELFASIVDAFAPSAEDTEHILTTDIEPNVAIIGDRELLTQLLANLLDNAIRHTGPGTAIRIELHRDTNRGIVANVSDNGPGVAESERERIFRRFHRLPKSHVLPGSGLGLSLVRAIAEIHDIALAVEDARPGLRVCMRFQDVELIDMFSGAAAAQRLCKRFGVDPDKLVAR